MVTSAMRDLVTFVLASIPLVAGLLLVLSSLKERSRVALARANAGRPTTSDRVGAPHSRRR
jgi:hypothetical protein